MANVELTDEANGSIRLRAVKESGLIVNSNNAENKSTLSTEQSSLEVSNTTAVSEDLVDEVKGEESIDINLIQRRVYWLSAGIGDTNRVYNRVKGWIGLVIWIFNMIIHFGLDFYEAVFVFQVSWATCIGLFLVTLVACCYSMIKHSVPWFINGVRKLEKDGHYPKTLKRVYFIFRVSMAGTVIVIHYTNILAFAVSATKLFVDLLSDTCKWFVDFKTSGWVVKYLFLLTSYSHDQYQTPISTEKLCIILANIPH